MDWDGIGIGKVVTNWERELSIEELKQQVSNRL
jgi:hypothetical protein